MSTFYVYVYSHMYTYVITMVACGKPGRRMHHDMSGYICGGILDQVRGIGAVLLPGAVDTESTMTQPRQTVHIRGG